MTLGIGSYGPSLVLFSLLGMDPRAAFPIMMGSGAFMGMVAAMRFVRSGRYAAPAAIGLTVGGIPGVLIAVWLVKSLPLDVVRWGVIAVVLYTALTLIRSASKIAGRSRASRSPPGEPRTRVHVHNKTDGTAADRVFVSVIIATEPVSG